MKVLVDFDLCESNAMCEALAPEVFELDDDDYLVVKKEHVGPEDLDSVRRAVASCPKAAISLQEAPTDG
ncbi:MULTISPECIES: ferredoxin [Nocardioides]|uniref:ferredoxin n=1 Tax=Nocardioides TaxID=1839 RepID=UPI0003F5AE31|nr:MULTISPECIES: ferredoxin [Nocardioides]